MVEGEGGNLGYGGEVNFSICNRVLPDILGWSSITYNT